MQQLYERIKDDYDVVEHHVKLHSRRALRGEIDLIGYKDGRVDVYEVKCSYRIYKARRQLEHIRRILNIPDLHMFFYHGAANEIVPIAS